jgi:glycosyltransferase involved in cell wall biosynthesis
MPDRNATISVCALVPYPPKSTPSQRFRIEQWQPYLQQQGIVVDLVPFVGSRLMRLLHQPGRLVVKTAGMAAAFVRRGLQVAAACRYDVVLVHRAACLVGPVVLERLLRLMPQPLLFDFDDAIYLLHTSEANQRVGWLKFPGKTASLCRLSTHVVVGNTYLADYARQYNRRVTVIPSSVDTQRYQPATMNTWHGRVVVGWMGSATSQTYLEMFTPVLRQIVARRDIELRVVSDRKPALPGVPFVWRRWSAESEAEELRHFDIGIMPMPDDPWARGKCAMKALQYLGMGIPAVCSAVGMNKEVIEHGVNGFLATTPEVWLTHLEALIDDPERRLRMGRAGRQTVAKRYSMRRCATLFASVVRDIARV